MQTTATYPDNEIAEDRSVRVTSASPGLASRERRAATSTWSAGA